MRVMPNFEADRSDASEDWAELGLEYGTVSLTEARPEWGAIAGRLAERIRAALGGSALGVEHVGSTAVPGLATKPIVDLAVGMNEVCPEVVSEPLARLGFIYRGDAREQGGLVFVLEDRPRHRVAHVHAVQYGGPQWERYIVFRDLLRGDASARAAYARTKTELARRFPNDRKAYQTAKDAIVRRLLAGGGEHDDIQAAPW